MPFVWSIGTIIGPSIGGTFANPAVTFPSLFSASGLFGKLPYLLPNLLCAAILLISIVAGYFFLSETHPDMQRWSTQADLDNTSAETPLMATAGAVANSGVDLRGESYGTFNQVDIHEDERWHVNSDGSSRPSSISPSAKEKVFTKRVLMLIVAFGIFAYHSMAYDHLLPIFLQDDQGEKVAALGTSLVDIPGGLGMTTQQVGIIMSINGLIALFIQAIIFPLVTEWLGVWKTFLMVTILHPVAYFIVPYIAILPGKLVSPGIYACLTLRNLFCILAYPILLILIKEACPKPSVLGRINGLAASAGAACRTVAPPLAGLLYGIGAKEGFTGLAWWGSGLVAIIGAVQLFWIEREKNKTATVKSAAPCMMPASSDETKPEVIHIVVTEV